MKKFKVTWCVSMDRKHKGVAIIVARSKAHAVDTFMDQAFGDGCEVVDVEEFQKEP